MVPAASRSGRYPPSDVRTEIVVVGGGIVGCAAAAILADRGARVTLIEREAIGAGASGRNLGAIQHPFDPALVTLHEDSLTRYEALSGHFGFRMPAAPVGLLLLNPDADAAALQRERMARMFPELRPEYLDPAAVVAVEPSLRAGPAGVRLETGYPIPPASATAAWAALAEERGVDIRIGQPARVVVEDGRAKGVRTPDGRTVAADAVLLATGPWTPPVADPSGAWAPIHATWGVTLQIRLDGRAPRHIVEEDEVDAINRSAAATARAAETTEDGDPPSLFSIASADGVSTIGSTFLPTSPDPGRIEPLLLRRAAAFLPAVAKARVLERRVCARPQSVDGRPFIGPLAGVDGLHICAGHGPWGISTGPASAAIAARAILDGTGPPADLAADRIV
jgi:D-hydroxyproline dehydrogenase subunit beta